MTEDLEKLKYPIGRFQIPTHADEQQLKNWINTIADFPDMLKNAVEHLSDEDLEKQYRPGGWTIRQVVHHCADSHMISFMRFKLALTEDTPVVQAYDENMWAGLPDAKHYSINSSLTLIDGLHDRWAQLLNGMSLEDYDKAFLHPVTKQRIPLKINLAIYAWHCEHHLAHIGNAKKGK